MLGMGKTALLLTIFGLLTSPGLAFSTTANERVLACVDNGGRSLASVQTMPDCKTLSELWVNRYHPLLKVKFPLAPLPCDAIAMMGARPTRGATTKVKHEFMRRLIKAKVKDPYGLISYGIAQGAYLLDSTEFQRSPMLISNRGLVDVPPASMLSWVAKRAHGGIDIITNEGFPSADVARGIINLPKTLEGSDGIEFAGQLIHEARHINFPPIYHTRCVTPVNSDAQCDESLTEYFNSATAGPHAVAALWLSWIAKRSKWNPEIKGRAEAVVRWIVQNRVNNTEMEKMVWLRKYLGTPGRFQDVYPWPKALKTSH